jgi:site-specific DNA recombinase
VVFRSATEPFDTSTPAGRMLVQMLGVFAEFEREMIIDRVVNGMERKADKGQWTLGVAPYGYRVDPTTQHLVPIHDESVIVKVIFQLYTVRRIRSDRQGTYPPWPPPPAAGRGLQDRHRHLIRQHRHCRVPRRAGRAPSADHRPRGVRARRSDPDRTRRTRQGRGRRLWLPPHGKDQLSLCGKAYLGMTATGRNRTYRYYTCFTPHPASSRSLRRHRPAAVGDFYHTRTDLITQAITAAQDDYRATRPPSKPNGTVIASWPERGRRRPVLHRL